tara:strand:+ start:130 stop:417 length:288 start_codon:yes stop_codon:yes gene_type:complete
MNQFKQFFGLVCETKILEACNWSEDRAGLLMDVLSDALQSCISSGNLSIDDVRSVIEKTPRVKISKEEMKVLLEVVQDSVDNIQFLMMKDAEYEN